MPRPSSKRVARDIGSTWRSAGSPRSAGQGTARRPDRIARGPRFLVGRARKRAHEPCAGCGRRPALRRSSGAGHRTRRASWRRQRLGRPRAPNPLVADERANQRPPVPDACPARRVGPGWFSRLIVCAIAGLAEAAHVRWPGVIRRLAALWTAAASGVVSRRASSRHTRRHTRLPVQVCCLPLARVGHLRDTRSPEAHRLAARMMTSQWCGTSHSYPHSTRVRTARTETTGEAVGHPRQPQHGATDREQDISCDGLEI